MSVYFYGCITMDGYLADKDHGLDWLHQSGTPEETDYDEFYRRMDVTIMGRRTFRELEKAGGGDFYPSTQNFVFTHSSRLSLPGFLPVNADVVEFVRAQGENKNIWIVGGNTILAPLLEQDMIDHIILQLAPVLLGAGIPLFTQAEALRRFRLREVKQYGQFAQLVYDRACAEQE